MTARRVSVVLCLLYAAGAWASSGRALAQQVLSDELVESTAPEEEPVAEPPQSSDAALAESSASDAATPAQDADERIEPAHGVYANVAVGGGIGARTISIPSRRSDRRLSTGIFPSVQVGLQGEFALRRLLLGAAATYNTAVGLQAASIMPLSGNSVDGAQLRSNSLTLGFVPGYRFGDPYDSIALRVFVGWGFRSMHTVVDLETPSYSLHGPTLRPELTVPLNDGLIVLRLAPELQIIAGASRALASLSNSSLPGVAFGGEASLQVRLIAGLYAALAYRESYAMVNTSWGSYIRDSERFICLQVSLHRH